jgi:hypothetical protein
MPIQISHTADTGTWYPQVLSSKWHATIATTRTNRHQALASSLVQSLCALCLSRVSVVVPLLVHRDACPGGVTRSSLPHIAGTDHHPPVIMYRLCQYLVSAGSVKEVARHHLP